MDRTMAWIIAGASLLTGCTKPADPPAPSVAFTRIPLFSEGDPGKLDPIEGRASGAQPGDRIVLYAKSGDWWIQPLAAEPFTELHGGSVWKNQTHPGLAYAALLVRAGYHPALRTDALPAKGGDVRALAMVETAVPPTLPGTEISFAGYQWQVRRMSASPGGTFNVYDPANAWTDPAGFLHLRIAGSPEHWTSAEVNLGRSLGYGTYRIVVSDLAHLEPSVVFTMLTADHDVPPREMDIEISKWGEIRNRNGQFVIQPYHVAANTVQFQTPPGETTFMWRWTPGRADFRVFHGQTAVWDSPRDAPALRQHVFTSGVPSPGDESLHMNLYVFGRNSNPLRHGNEVVVEKFEYLP
jgi:hypothetical protein